MDQQTTAVTENTVKHLCSSASALTSSTLSNILKSYYLTKCRMMTLSGAVTLPQRFSKSTVRCPRCCVLYEDGPVSFKIQPARKKNRFVRRLLKRNASGKSLTRFQDAYLKNLTNKGDADAHNVLVITCGICKRETKEKLRKPEEQLNVDTAEETAALEPSKPRKKKKKKDRFSGLDKNAVLSATPQNKPYNTSHHMSLEATPIPKTDTARKDIGNKKNLFSKNKRNSNQKNGKVKKNSKEYKEKQKNLKGLSSILNDSKKSKSSSASLKLFLTSI